MSTTQENASSDEDHARATMEAEESVDTLQGTSVKTNHGNFQNIVTDGRSDLRMVDRQEEKQPNSEDVSLQDDGDGDSDGDDVDSNESGGKGENGVRRDQIAHGIRQITFHSCSKLKGDSDDHSPRTDHIAHDIRHSSSRESSTVSSLNNTSSREPSLVHDKRLLLRLTASQHSHRKSQSESCSELLQDRQRKFRLVPKRRSSYGAYKPDKDQYKEVIVQEVLQQSKEKHPTNVDDTEFVDKYMWSGDNYDIDPMVNIHKTNTPYTDDTRYWTCFTVCLLLLFLFGAVLVFDPFQGYKSFQGYKFIHAVQKHVAVRKEPLTQDQLLNILLPISPNLLDALSNSPQRKAFEWLHSTQDLTMSEKRLGQRYILAVLYHFTSGTQWNMGLKIKNWLTNQYECEWTGVKCHDFCENEDDVHTIRGLKLQDADLDGEFPDEISHLKDLEELLLPDNHLKGSIPSSIFQLSNLKLLELQHNEFQGGIPKPFYKLTQLQSLNLSHNQLIGVIPYGIGNLKFLTYLNLSYNQLEGELPMEFMNLKQLKELRLERNTLVGEIPNWVDQWQSLEVLSIQQNEFFGAISNIGNMTHVAHLDLSENAFEGTIPDLQHSTKLEVINLSKNKLSGPSPRIFPSQIMEVHVSHNQLTGFIPEVWGSSLKKLTMQGNLLEGSMPEKVCDLKLRVLESDCGGIEPRVQCGCCTGCFA